MTAFEKMKMREGAQGNTTRNEMIYNAKYIVDSLLPNDPSYKENVMIHGKGRLNLRMNKYRVLAGTTPVMDIQASLEEPVTFTLGDVFMYGDGYQKGRRSICVATGGLVVPYGKHIGKPVCRGGLRPSNNTLTAGTS